MSFSLAGKTALVTGSSTGLGREIAMYLGKAGAKVAMNYANNQARADEALDTGATVIAANCPFCLTMMTDGVKARDKQDDVEVYDLAEMIVKNKAL